MNFLARVAKVVPLAQPLQQVEIRELPRARKGAAAMEASALEPLLAPLLAGHDLDLSRFVEIQPGQRVITSGPYRFVRHALYAAMSVYFVSVPLALGSFWGMLPAAGLVALLMVRAVLEDRTLLRDLPGYREYAEHVRFRIVPGLW